MNPGTLIPITEPIQVHWAISEGFLIGTFILHVLVMNALVGGAVIALTTLGRADGPAPLLAKRLPTVMALTINFGVAPLLFLQVDYGHFDYVSSVLMGGWWLAVIPVLILGYYGFYIHNARQAAPESTGRFSLIMALVCVFYVGFMFSNNMTMMLDPAKWVDYFSSNLGLLMYTDHPVLYPRFLHFVAGALAVGGLFTALLGRYGAKPGVMATGMNWFTWATLVNLCVGVWFLATLPRNILLLFLGGNTIATAVLGLGVLGGLLLVLAGIKRYVGLALVATIPTVALMAVARHLLRQFYLAPHYRIQDVTVTGQYSPLAVCLGILVLGLAAIFYMLRLYAKALRGA